MPNFIPYATNPQPADFVGELNRVIAAINTGILAGLPVSSGGTGNQYNNDRPWRINGIGDSITARSVYHPYNIDYTNLCVAPTWTPGATVTTNQLVRSTSNNILLYCTTGGTTGTVEPTWGVTGTTSDGTAVWTAYVAQAGKGSSSFLSHVERSSGGSLVFDMTTGYAAPEFSLIKVIVINGGSGYIAPTISFSVAGASATVQTSNGVITGVTITNSGRNATGALTYTLTDASGTGAVLSLVHTNSGTFGVSGCRTRDMVARLPDVIASQNDIITVLGGTNDCTLDVTTFADMATQLPITIANLQNIYETLMSAGKKVVAIPILPRTGLTAPKIAFINRVNTWIRDYVRSFNYDNPRQVQIALADPTVLLTDSSASYSPVGGSGGSIGAVTVDGLHPSPLGAMIIADAVLKACQAWTGPAPTRYPRPASYGSGYSLSYNPSGNYLEGLPWVASTVYQIGDLVANDTAPVKVYRCTTGGTSAASGGPTGTGGAITDGTVTWAYVRGSALSTLGSGTGGTNSAAAGITFVGSLCTGLTLARQSGSASGTITEAIENPWSNGQVGVRQSIGFSLGGGTNAENWRVLITSSALASFGILASELANNLFIMEVELELSNVVNMYYPSIQLFGQSAVVALYGGYDAYSGAMGPGNGGSTGYEMLPSNGVITMPNNGLVRLSTPPCQLPYGLTQVNAALYLSFNASGAAGSATGLVKINNISIRKWGVT